jgi:hypothetical protein
MSLVRLTVNRVMLPQELLSLAKQHMRVDFDDDDQVIVHKLANAIATFERLTGFGVFPATWTWVPETSDYATPPDPAPSNMIQGGLWATVPVMRVGAWSAVDSGNINVTSSYALHGSSGFESVDPQYLYGTVARTSSGLTTTLSTGYDALDLVPPDITDIVLRIAGYLYEYREVQQVPGVDGVAYANTLLAGYWVPRC